MRHTFPNLGHYPDGLTEEVIDGLLAEADTAAVSVRRPTSPFAMHELDMRRERRRMNRQVSRVVRVLPLATPAAPVVRGRAA